MTVRRADIHRLPAAAARNLPMQAIGKLTPVPSPQVEALSFTAFDVFDQTLRKSGRLLLETSRSFELLSDDTPLISESIKGRPRFLGDFPEGPLKRALNDLSPLRCLLPVGTGVLRQTTLSFVDQSGKTHCRAHLLQIDGQDGRRETLVKLQGIKGYGKSLSRLRDHIVELSGDTASCRTLYTVFPPQAAYDAKPDIRFADSDTALDAANRIISRCIPIMRANESGIIADHDTEFLHDYRVQLRKIRSVLSLFKGVYDDTQTGELKRRFSELAAQTGRLRDLDVYLLKKSEYHALLPESLHNGLDALLDTLRRQRVSEKNKLGRHLRSAAYEREITALGEIFSRPKALVPGEQADQPAHSYACERIWQRYRKVRRIALDIGPHTEDAEVHELRIHCKKLRYLIEFFGAAFPQAELKRLLKPLKRLQDTLGLFNDYSVQQQSLQAFLQAPGRRGGARSTEIAQSVGALTTVLHSRQLEEREKLMACLAQFNRPTVQQTFTTLFQLPENHT